MRDVVVIGAGLFGSVIAKHLIAQGRDVLVLDDKRKNSGTSASGFLMKPSWFSSIGKDKYEPSLELLHETCEVETLKFKAGKLINVSVYRLKPKSLKVPVTFGKVTAILRSSVLPRTYTVFVESVDPKALPGQQLLPINTGMVVIAAGVWTSALRPVEGLVGKAGVSFKFKGQVPDNYIMPWAPYKQVVAYNWDKKSIWIGDGRSILEKNWSLDHFVQCRTRCADSLGQERMEAKAHFGIRPYIKGKKFWLEERKPGLWIATGGAKNGAVAAGWCAYEIGRRL